MKISGSFTWQHASSLLVILGLLLSLAQPAAVLARPQEGARVELAPGPFSPLVVLSVKNDVLPSLRELAPKRLEREGGSEIPDFILPKALSGLSKASPIIPLAPARASIQKDMPTPLLSIEGISNLFGGWPPDTQGDIGSNYYVQWINVHFAVWEIDRGNHTATQIYGPVPGNTLFQGFGGACESTNDGDPITLYDPFADRWLMGQFALPNYPNGPFYECIAVSKTSDPTGAWNRYQFQLPVNKMNDYPKFGVWPNAYFMTVNQFNAGTLNWGGAGVAALERQAMLDGDPAQMVYFDLYSVNSKYGGMLPADFDGIIPPPGDAPGYFAEWDDSTWIPPQDAIRLWEFRANWTDPEASTFGISGNPDFVIPTADVDPDLCGYSRNCIPQPDTSNRLDAISDRLMYRLQYRNFGGYETLVTNHTVDVDSADHAGIHWFELQRSGSTWSMNQEGVFAPDSDHRWMGSIAMDTVGNMALGYSVSSGSTYPSVRYTGRLEGDPLGALPQGEQSLAEGGGSQTGANRWGDYSMMGVDPLDDCTFWYTQQYIAVTGSNTWVTRIGSFRFPNCSIGPQGTLGGQVTDNITHLGVSGAEIRVTLNPTQTLTSQTRSDGTYGINLPVGVYNVAASSYGYLPQTETGVIILEDTTTTLDFALDPAPVHTVSGVVKDAITGWPRYARISIGETPLSPIWNDPVSGQYSLALPEGAVYNFYATAFVAGYFPASLTVGPLSGDLIQDIELEVDEQTCATPGYQILSTPVFAQDFEADNGGLTVSGAGSWAWGVPTSGPNTAHSGVNVWATNLAGYYGNSENGYLNLPPLDLSAPPDQSPVIRWWQWLQTEWSYDLASLEASKDGGNTWSIVYGPVSGDVDLHWTEHTLLLDPSYAISNLQLRFHFTSDISVVWPGWYIDDLSVGSGGCDPQLGGLVVGNVYDENTSLGIVDARIVNESGFTASSQATPSDPGVADGFYTLFSPADTHVFTATQREGYRPTAVNVDVVLNNTVRQDFSLQAGRLVYTPDGLDVSLKMGRVMTVPLTVTNEGGVTAAFELIELNKGSVPLGPFQSPQYVAKPFRQNLPTSQLMNLPDPPPAAPLAAGEVIRSWTASGVNAPWGIAYDGAEDTIWVSSPGPGWNGDDLLYEFTQDGVLTGRTHPHTPAHYYGPADLAFDWNTGMLWAMYVNTGVANCIYEVNPEAGYTGNVICPGGGSGFSISQRGLAYDPSTDTWFAGGWNDMMIYRFDSAGNIISSVHSGIPTAGLAYNPETQHLFVMSNSNPTRIYVLDVANSYVILGDFSVSGFQAFGGAGMEFDCEGNLWAIDQNSGTVYQFESGETTTLCVQDVPWLSEKPSVGEIAPASNQVVDVTLDARAPAVSQPGQYFARLKFKHNTPYLVNSVPVTMTVLPLAYGVDLSPDMTAHNLPDETVTYTLQLTNTSEGPADSFVLSLSAHFWPTSLSQTLVGPLAMGDSAEVQVSVHIPLAAMGSETVVVKASSQGDPAKYDTAALTTIVDEPVSDLEVTQSASANALTVGDLLTYTIVITNHGPTKALQVSLVDILPLGAVLISNDAGCTFSGNVMDCVLGKFDAGESRKVTMVVIQGLVGRLSNHAIVVADGDPDHSNNWAMLFTQVNYWLGYFPWIFNR